MLDEVSLPPESRLSEDEHAKELAWWKQAYQSAEDARKPWEERWERYYQLKRSYVPARAPGDWNSKVFIPLVFFTIQTVLPRLVAQLPSPLVKPVGPEDIDGAKKMEDRLKWAMEQSELMLAMVETFDTALTYGTGIMKVRPMKRTHKRKTLTPLMEPLTVSMPVTDPSTGQPMMDINGQPMVTEEQVGEQPVLDEMGQPQTESVDEEVTSYVGPVAEALDIFNVFVAPDAKSVEDARYIIQRRYIEREEFLARVKDGTYTRPENVGAADFFSLEDDPQSRRADAIGMGAGAGTDSTRKQIEIWECWKSDGTVTTIANQKAIVRQGLNPFRHGEFPFVRVVDYLNPFEFWGTGEVEHLEGIQDSVNAMWNQRIDNIRLLLNAMFMIDSDAITDKTDLRIRPGGTIRVQNPNGLPLQNVIERIDLGEVNSSAFTEVSELIAMSEKISGANGYTSGAMPVDTTNQTATGAAILSEQGNARFSLKSAIAEMTGLNRLMRLYGELMQQFTPPDMMMRVDGATNIEEMFVPIGPEALEAALDYTVEAESTTQTETVRQNQSMSLFNTLIQQVDPMTGMPLVNPQALVEDVLHAYGKRAMDRYAPPQPQMPPMDPSIDPVTGMPIEQEGAPV